MADRRAQYKQHGKDSADSLRNKRRQDDIAIRKEKREKFVSSKRFRLEDEDTGEEISQDEVCDLSKKIQRHGTERLQDLKTLRQALAQGTVYIDVFFSVENSLNCIVGLLTGNDVELQQEAAWAVTNISAGTHEHAMAVAKSAAPYLVTYLSSSNHLMQDQCAWALGNLAGDGSECRSLLHAQGALPPLVKLLQSPVPAVVRSAAFALSNLARESADITRDIVKAGVIDSLPPYLNMKPDGRTILAELSWLLTYLTTSGEHTEEMVKNGILPAVVDLLVKLCTEEPQDGQTITPLLRCLGNICSGPDEYTFQACDNPRLVHTLGTYLDSSIRHIVKETLWVLSNMAGEASVCQALALSPLLQTIVTKLQAGFDIKQEALYVLCNMAWHGEDSCRYLVDNGVLHEVVPVLKSTDVELLHLALSFCEMAVRMTDCGTEIFEACEGVARLEALEYHSNEKISSMANDMLEKYFLVDQEEEEHQDELG